MPRPCMACARCAWRWVASGRCRCRPNSWAGGPLPHYHVGPATGGCRVSPCFNFSNHALECELDFLDSNICEPIVEEPEVGQLRLVRIESLSAWRAQARAWDDLWSRSDVGVPTARSEMIAQWLEEFSPGQPFCAFIVADGDVFLAGVVLVSTRIKRLVKVGSLLSNEWCTCGDLLVASQSDTEAVLDLLAKALAEAPWPLVWLDDVPYESPRWKALLAAFDRAGLGHSSHASFAVGLVRCTGSWAEYEASLKRNHRCRMHRLLERSEVAGGIELERWPAATSEQVETLLRRGFEIEDRNRNSVPGTSVLRTPQAFDYLCRQARQLAQWNQLELTFLRLAGQPIAFEFGYRSKQTYFSYKLCCDESFASLRPDQLLRAGSC